MRRSPDLRQTLKQIASCIGLGGSRKLLKSGKTWPGGFQTVQSTPFGHSQAVSLKRSPGMIAGKDWREKWMDRGGSQERLLGRLPRKVAGNG
jgi:hypothetical protein